MSELIRYLTADIDEVGKIRAVNKGNRIQIWVDAARVQELLDAHVAEVLREVSGESTDTLDDVAHIADPYIQGLKAGIIIARDIVRNRADKLDT